MRSALVVLSFLFATPALAQSLPERYQLDLTVMRDGVEIVAARTQIMEDTTATATVTTGETAYAFSADLFAVQGDGSDAQLMLEANLSRGSETIAAPSLTFLRGREARIEIQEADGDSVSLTLTPTP